MKKLMAILLCTALFASCNDEKKDATTSDTKTSDSTASNTRGFEFGDDKFTAIGKSNAAAMGSGDIDAMVSAFADDAVYRWNGGDSLSGKAAINDYWKKRRGEVIDSLWFKNQVWLPMVVKTPQYEGQMTGNYLLSWNMVTAKYKNGKSMTQRSHTVMHFNADDKIDRYTHYLDKAPINAAAGK